MSPFVLERSETVTGDQQRLVEIKYKLILSFPTTMTTDPRYPALPPLVNMILVVRLGQGDPGADRGRGPTYDPQAHVRQHRHPPPEGHSAARASRDGKDASRESLRQTNRCHFPQAGGPAACAGMNHTPCPGLPAFLLGNGGIEGREEHTATNWP